MTACQRIEPHPEKARAMMDATGRLSILTLNQAAAWLHMHPATVREKAARGELPAAKPGKCWIFLEIDLIAWLRAQYARAGSVDQEKTCHSTDDRTANIGGLRSRLQTVAQYEALLRRPTAKRPKRGSLK